MVACVLGGTVAIGLIDWALSWVGGLFHGESIPTGAIDDELGAALVNNGGYAVLGFAIAFLTRSMAGGITTTLVIALVVDNAIGAIPTVGDYNSAPTSPTSPTWSAARTSSSAAARWRWRG